MAIVQQPDASSVRVIAGVKAKLGEIRQDFPNLKFDVAYDNSTFVGFLMDNMVEELVLAVLLTGGIDDSKMPLSAANATSTAEIFDPTTMTFAATGSMSAPRFRHSVARLSSGKVLVAGCADLNACDVTADVYDPSTGTFTATAPPGIPSCLSGDVALAPLPAGRALLVGSTVAKIYEANGSWTNVSGVTPSPRWRATTRRIVAGSPGPSGSTQSAR